MKINGIANTQESRDSVQVSKAVPEVASGQGSATEGKGYTLEISKEGYQLQKASAVSGKSTLGVKKRGDHYIIRFRNSAEINRVIKNGSITVNGVQIELSDEVKERLGKLGEQAEKERSDIFEKWLQEQNAEAAKQSAEAAEEEFGELAKMIEIARRIAKGGRVPGYDEQKLIEFSSDMYQMAKAQAMLAKEHKKYDSLYEDEEEDAPEEKNDLTSAPENKNIEVQMEVSLSGEPSVQSISVESE